MRAEVWRLPLPATTPVVAANWESSTPLPSPYAFGGAAVMEETIYLAGGYNGQHETDRFQRYTLGAESWELLPPLTQPRGGIQLVYDGFAIFAVGGGWTASVETLERFDPATGLWSHIPAPVGGEWRNLAAASNQGDYLYFVGGWSGGYLNTFLQYQSSFRSFLPSTRNEQTP